MRLQKKVIFLSFLFCGAACLAQSPDTTLAYRLLKEADMLSQPPQQQMDMTTFNDLVIKNSNEAMWKAKAAKGIFEQAIGYDCAQVAEALHYMGRCYLNKGRVSTALYPMAFDSSLIVNREALKIRKKIFLTPNALVGNSYLNIGIGLISMKHFDEAIENVLNAFEVYNVTLEADNPRFMMCYDNLSLSYFQKNDDRNAYNPFLLLLNKRKLISTKSFEVAYLNTILGNILLQNEEYSNAIPHYNLAMEIFERNIFYKPAIVSLKNSIFTCYSKMNNWSKIEEIISKDLHTLPINSSAIIDDYFSLMNYFLIQHKYKEGIDYFDSLLNTTNQAATEEHLVIYMIKGRFKYNIGSFEDALADYQKALQLSEFVNWNDDDKNMKAFRIGRLYMEMGIAYTHIDNINAIKYLTIASLLLNNEPYFSNIISMNLYKSKKAVNAGDENSSGYGYFYKFDNTYKYNYKYLLNECWDIYHNVNFSNQTSFLDYLSEAEKKEKDAYVHIKEKFLDKIIQISNQVIDSIGKFEKEKRISTNNMDMIDFDPAYYYMQIGKAYRLKSDYNNAEKYLKLAHEVALKYYGNQHYQSYKIKKELFDFYSFFLNPRSIYESVYSSDDENANFEKYRKSSINLIKKYIDCRFFPDNEFVFPYYSAEQLEDFRIFETQTFLNFKYKIKKTLQNINENQNGNMLNLAYIFLMNFYCWDVLSIWRNDDLENRAYSDIGEMEKFKFYQKSIKEKVKNTYPLFLREYIDVNSIFDDNIVFDTTTSKNKREEIFSNNIDLIIKVAVKRAEKLFNDKITGNRVSDSEDLEKIIALGIEVNQNLYTRTKDNQYRYKILEYLEANKAKALRQVMNQNNVFEELSPELQSKERKLRKALKDAETALNSAPNEYQLKLVAERDKCEQEYNTFKEEIRTSNAKYFAANYSSQISVNHIQKNILKDNNTSIVNYYFNKDSLYTILINKEAFEIYVTDTIGIQAQVNDLLENIKKKEPQFVTSACSLYQKLIAPIDAAILKENLVINPDGVLNYIPFEVLLKKKPTSIDEEKGRYWYCDYLGNTKIISYDYGVSTMKEKKELKNRENKLLALAPFYDEKSIKVLWYPKEQYYGSNTKIDTLKTLPESKREINEIAQYFSKNTQKLGLAASLSLFRDSASYYNLIHINSHGMGYKNSSFKSCITFKTEHSFDKLYVRDIYQLNLNADLVTLSACETSVGNIEKGEGVISIARAFSYAGAKSVATSLWEVNESSTTQLMTAFYQNLSKGWSKDKALQEAKRTILNKKDDFSHPYYWSGFIIYGDTSALNR